MKSQVEDSMVHTLEELYPCRPVERNVDSTIKSRFVSQ